jgi:tRNA U34 5-methylaminomethyl-2-thiouridine-forming methyltransferase MnmC
LKREIIQTKDGSTTIYLPELKETYHSKQGAIKEAYHVFIKNGFSLKKGKPISVLEIGLGTGLNAIITYSEALKDNQKVFYVGVEAYPVAEEELLKMNYCELINTDLTKTYLLLHQTEFGIETKLSANFTLLKRKQFFQDIRYHNVFDLIYFDAFNYDVQPELWSAAIFEIMYKALKKDGVLTTYACRSVIKRNMVSAGFKVIKLPGAPGKREMLQAIKV